MNCKNCNQIVNGAYCSFCGQNSKVSTSNLFSFINEITESVFQINKGLFYTLKELSIRPAIGINEFLDGKRKSHFKPIAYVFTFSTLVYLIKTLG